MLVPSSSSTLIPYQTLNEEKTVIDGVVIIEPCIFFKI